MSAIVFYVLCVALALWNARMTFAESPEVPKWARVMFYIACVVPVVCHAMAFFAFLNILSDANEYRKQKRGNLQ